MAKLENKEDLYQKRHGICRNSYCQQSNLYLTAMKTKPPINVFISEKPGGQ